jgi:hypothetical protein
MDRMGLPASKNTRTPRLDKALRDHDRARSELRRAVNRAYAVHRMIHEARAQDLRRLSS